MFNDDRFKIKRKTDDEMYNDAFRDLLSVLGISTLDDEHKVKRAISGILEYFGEKIPEVDENVTSLTEQLEYMLRPSGMMKRRIELVGDWWKHGFGCILSRTKNGNIALLYPGKFGGYFYFGRDGKKIKINSKTASELEIDAFCFYKSFPLSSLKIKDLVKFMIKSVSLFDLGAILLVCVILQLLGMIIPYITNVIYNIVIPSKSTLLWQIVLSTYLGITVGQLSLDIIKSIVKYRIQLKLNLSINSAIMIRLFNLPTSFFSKYSAGDLSSRISYVNTLCEIISGVFFSTFFSSVLSLGYIFQMLGQASSMVFPAIIASLSSLIFTTLVIFMRQKINIKKVHLNPKLQSLVFNIFNGIQKIKIAGAEKRAFAVWAQQYSEVQKLDYNIPTILKISPVISMVISSLGTIALYWVASSNKVPIANYMSFNIAYGAVSAAIASIGGSISQISSLKPILNVVEPFLKSQPEATSDGKLVKSLRGEIEVNNVVFRYKKGTDPILNKLNLKIKKGEYLGIVGKTGCGKSTLLRLLLGFENPETGAIYYDKVDLSTLDKKSLRQRIGVVMQNGAIFQGDIFSNIIISAPWKTMDDAWEAAKMAGFDKDIDNMPMGMHTLISEGSGGISGGQKQRLMIARAIINKPKILFFDEATSALDNITQKIVSDNIDSLNCTRVVIAHRLSTIKNCDRIIVLDKGNIKEEGTYDSLMKEKGYFYDLAIRQVL